MNLRETYEEEFEDYAKVLKYNELLDYIIDPLGFLDLMEEDMIKTGVGTGAGFAVGVKIGDLVNKVLGPAATQVGEAGGDAWGTIRAIQKNHLDRFLKRWSKEVEERKISPQPIEFKTFVRILQEASKEVEESELNEKWISLLTFATAGNRVHPSYPQILSELDPIEARILERLVDVSSNELVPSIREGRSTEFKEKIQAKLKVDALEEFFSLEGQEIAIAIQNIFRLGLCTTSERFDDGIARGDAVVRITSLGVGFIKAVHF